MDLPLEKTFDCIVADPPWTHKTYSDKGKERSAERHYPCMTRQEIIDLPVKSMTKANCHLFLWITGPQLVIGAHLPIMTAWGFTPSSMAFVWVKPLDRLVSGHLILPPVADVDFSMGLGHTTRQNAEFCLLGRRGDPRRDRKDIRQIIVAQRREHSRKPEEFHRKVRDYVGPDKAVLELFAREERPQDKKWSVWGNEVGKFEVVA